VIGFELTTGDGPICCAEINEHGGDCNIGEAKCVVIQCCEIEVLHGIQELVFHFFSGSGG